MSFGGVLDLKQELVPSHFGEASAEDARADRFPIKVARNEAIDVVRLIAAAGIVFTHAGESPAFDCWGNCFRFGVPFFLFASLYYQSASLCRNPDRTLIQLIRARVTRLYIPFLAWSVIYLLVRDLNRIIFFREMPVALHLSMLWTGTEYHLWFLPFLLMCSTLFIVMERALFRHDPRLRWPAIGIAIGIGLAIANGPMPLMPRVTEATFDSPSFTYVQWWLAMPAASWALAFTWLTMMAPIVSSFTPAVGLAGLALATACSLRQAMHGIELLPRGISGLGCIIAALSPWPGRSIPRLARLGRMGYGIYLCHVIPVEIIHVISHRCHLVPGAALDVSTFALSLVASFCIVRMLARMPRLAWLIAEQRSPITAINQPICEPIRNHLWLIESKSIAA